MFPARLAAFSTSCTKAFTLSKCCGGIDLHGDACPSTLSGVSVVSQVCPRFVIMRHRSMPVTNGTDHALTSQVLPRGFVASDAVVVRFLGLERAGSQRGVVDTCCGSGYPGARAAQVAAAGDERPLNWFQLHRDLHRILSSLKTLARPTDRPLFRSSHRCSKVIRVGPDSVALTRRLGTLCR